jgi:virginiamycin A acetyltransferase
MKKAAKILAMALAYLCVAPTVGLYWVSGVAAPGNHAFAGWSQLYSLFPGLTGVYLRRAFYRLVLPRCGRGSVVSFGTVFSHKSAEIGDHAYVGVYCCLGDVTLEDDVLVGSHVSIMNGSRQHGIERLDIPVREQVGIWPRITIGCDSWIGDRAIVMTNVGRHAVVGAGSVVTKPVPDYAIVVGSPARIVGHRGQSTSTEQPKAENDALVLT